MHIPDGYLSPQTYLPLYGITIPILAMAARRVKQTLRSRQAPYLALGAAFSFVIMMFNIPAPGGTSGHAVGAALVAILLGPWAACLAVSIALIIQALFFGDGGITALGANCLNMAVVMPFAGYYSYRLIAGSTPLTSKLRVLAGAVAGYLALNLAALYTAIQFGIQPLLASGADGRPLYAPYPLTVAVPAMALEHLLLFGFLEAAVTALVIGYAQRTDPALLAMDRPDCPDTPGTLTGLWWGLGLLALLSPLGIIMPAFTGAGPAWGEWGPEELQKMLGYLPSGLKSTSEAWRAPLPNYAPASWDGAGLPLQALAYLLSAVAGIALAVAFVRLFGRYLAARGSK